MKRKNNTQEYCGAEESGEAWGHKNYDKKLISPVSRPKILFTRADKNQTTENNHTANVSMIVNSRKLYSASYNQ